jgi:hypothetical protein
MLRREGHAVNKKRVQRIYREEKLTVRRRGGRKRAMGTRRPLDIRLFANQRWSPDFVSDQMTDGRRFRILTVIDGAGIALHAPDGVLTALPLHPVAFDGATPIKGRLLNGAILDLNLIYDPTRFKGQVERLTPPCHHTHGGDGVIGLLALSAGIMVDACPLPSGSFAFGEGGEVACEPGAVALRVILRPLP